MKNVPELKVPDIKKFLYKLKLKWSGSALSIPLDDLKADECICQDNVGSYKNRLDKCGVLMVRSNMCTYKTQNLKE